MWGLDSYDEENRQGTAFWKEDNQKLQVLMNKVLRSLTGLEYETPVTVLLESSGQLSVHQRSALFTQMSVHKTLHSKNAVYSHSVLKLPPEFVQNPRHPSNSNRVEYKLSLSREGYFYREANFITKFQ